MGPRVAPLVVAPQEAEMIRDDKRQPVSAGRLAPLEGVHSFRMELTTTCCGKHKVKVLDNATGAPLLAANEESDLCCDRYCNYPRHDATMHFTDVRPGAPADSQVFKANKPSNCFMCFSVCDMCRAEMTASYPPDPLHWQEDDQGIKNKISKTQEQECDCSSTLRMDVTDKAGTKFAEVQGPGSLCFGHLYETTFVVLDVDKAQTPVGHIKQLVPAGCGAGEAERPGRAGWAERAGRAERAEAERGKAERAERGERADGNDRADRHRGPQQRGQEHPRGASG
jgi:hypothetical protein